jgi:TRAP-type C4-dicarboxylate transport system permease small subunit
VSHDFEVTEAGLEQTEPEHPPPGHPVLEMADRVMQWVNAAVMVPCMLALVAASAILSYSVIARYFLKIPTDWQDETAIFLLVGATFFSGAFVQSYRGHVGIDAVAHMLGPRANRFRLIFVDGVSFVFCSFFAWKSWTLFAEALHEGQTTTSTWGPPLWIPYGLMSLGMTLLSLQLLLEFLGHVAGPARRPA